FRIVNGFYVCGSAVLKQPGHLFFSKKVIRSFNTDEKPVIRGFVKTIDAKERIVKTRQIIECKHAKNSRKCSEQYCNLKRNRHIYGNIKERLSTDVQRIVISHNPDHERQDS